MFACRPARHVESDLTEHLQGRQLIHAITLPQDNTGQRTAIHVDVKAWSLLLARAPFAGRCRLRRSALHVCHKRLETPFNLRPTRPPLLLNKLILLEGLLQRKEMLGPPVTFQG